MSPIAGKKGPKIISFRDDRPYIEKFGSRLIRSLTNDLMTCTMIVGIRCGLQENIAGGLSYSKIREKMVKFFLQEVLHFFQKKIYFPQPLRCYRNDPITSIVIVKIPFGPI